MVRIEISGSAEESLIRKDIREFRQFVERAFGGVFRFLRDHTRRLIRIETKINTVLTALTRIEGLIGAIDLTNLEENIVRRISEKITDAIDAINTHTDAKVADILLKLDGMDAKIDELLRLLRAINIPNFPDYDAQFAELRRMILDLAGQLANCADKHDVATIIAQIARLDLPLNQIADVLVQISREQGGMRTDIQAIIRDLQRHITDMNQFRIDAMRDFGEIKTKLQSIWDLLTNTYGPQLQRMSDTLNQLVGLVQNIQAGGSAPAHIDIHDLIGEINNAALNLPQLTQEIKDITMEGAKAYADAAAASMADAISKQNQMLEANLKAVSEAASVAAAEAASRAAAKAAADAASLAAAEAVAKQSQTLEAHLKAIAEALAVLIGREDAAEQQQIVNNYNFLINLIANIVIIINGESPGPGPGPGPGSLTAALIHSYSQTGAARRIENKKIEVYDHIDLKLFGALFGKPRLDYRWYVMDELETAELTTLGTGTIPAATPSPLVHEVDTTITSSFLVTNRKFKVKLHVKDEHGNEHTDTILVEVKTQEGYEEPIIEIIPYWHVLPGSEEVSEELRAQRENYFIFEKETGFSFCFENQVPKSRGNFGWRVSVWEIGDDTNNMAKELKLKILFRPRIRTNKLDKVIREDKFFKVSIYRKETFEFGSIRISLPPEEDMEAALRKRYKLVCEIGKWDPVANGRRKTGTLIGGDNYQSHPLYRRKEIIFRPVKGEEEIAMLVALEAKQRNMEDKVKTILEKEHKDLKKIKTKIETALPALLDYLRAGGVFRERATVDAFKRLAEDARFVEALQDLKDCVDVETKIEDAITKFHLREGLSQQTVIKRIKDVLGTRQRFSGRKRELVLQYISSLTDSMRRRNDMVSAADDMVKEINTILESLLLLLHTIITTPDNLDDIRAQLAAFLHQAGATENERLERTFGRIDGMLREAMGKIEVVEEISTNEIHSLQKLQELMEEIERL